MLMISKCILQYLQNQQMESCTKISEEVVAVWDETKRRPVTSEMSTEKLASRGAAARVLALSRWPTAHLERHTSQCVE